MPMPELPPPPPRPVEGLPPLSSVDRYPLPVSQTVVLPPGALPRASRVATSLLQTGGFTLVPRPRDPEHADAEPNAEGDVVYAERSALRVATHISMLATVGVLVGAGISLGAVDALVFGNLLYAAPWIAVGVVGASVLWWKYGRGYESELVAVHVLTVAHGARPLGESPATSPVGEVMWSAGRVRSVLFAGTRTVVGVVDCPIPLMRTLGAMARRFEAEISAPPVAHLAAESAA